MSKPSAWEDLAGLASAMELDTIDSGIIQRVLDAGRALEARVGVLEGALEDIKRHTIEPFLDYKWTKYAHQVASEALASLDKRLGEGG